MWFVKKRDDIFKHDRSFIRLFCLFIRPLKQALDRHYIYSVSAYYLLQTFPETGSAFLELLSQFSFDPSMIKTHYPYKNPSGIRSISFSKELFGHQIW